MVRAFFTTGLYGSPLPSVYVPTCLYGKVRQGGTCVHQDRFGIDKEEQSRLRQSIVTLKLCTAAAQSRDKGRVGRHTLQHCRGTIQKPPNLDLDPNQV